MLALASSSCSTIATLEVAAATHSGDCTRAAHRDQRPSTLEHNTLASSDQRLGSSGTKPHRICNQSTVSAPVGYKASLGVLALLQRVNERRHAHFVIVLRIDLRARFDQQLDNAQVTGGRGRAQRILANLQKARAGECSAHVAVHAFEGSTLSSACSPAFALSSARTIFSLPVECRPHASSSGKSVSCEQPMRINARVEKAAYKVAGVDIAVGFDQRIDGFLVACSSQNRELKTVA